MKWDSIISLISIIGFIIYGNFHKNMDGSFLIVVGIAGIIYFILYLINRKRIKQYDKFDHN